MSPFERDTPEHTDPADGAPREVAAPSGSTSDAEDAAAVIANLVRRSAQSHARADPLSVAGPDATAVLPQIPAEPLTQRFSEPLAQPSPEPIPGLGAPSGAQPIRRTMPRPSARTLIAGTAVVALLIAGGFALLGPGSSPGKPTPTSQGGSAPAVYAVKVTDVITDCANHSHGRTQTLFESQNCVKATRFLASGQVRGRPVLYVVSQIQMPSPDAAASVKQVLDSNGTGNLNDLLLEGKTFPGAPSKMPDSGYASIQTGAVVLVAEAGFDDGGPSSDSNPALRAAAAQVAAMVRTRS
jgi:hypothetical protein